ncbi:hypothetical protein FOXYSP1_11598 [Fusarium oxysporum f. sp. phaseoli]
MSYQDVMPPAPTANEDTALNPLLNDSAGKQNANILCQCKRCSDQCIRAVHRERAIYCNVCLELCHPEANFSWAVEK